MSLEENFNEFARDSKQFQGQVMAELKNLGAYIGAVSQNVKEAKSDLKEHVEDNDAHALGLVRERGNSWLSSLGTITAIIFGLSAFVMAFKNGH